MKRYLISCWLLLPFMLWAQQDGLLWKISGPQLKQPSYLFGTMHTTDSRVFQFPPTVKNSLNACDAFAMEILLEDNSLDLSLIMRLMMKDGTTLKALFTPEEYNRLDSLLSRATGFPLAMLDRVQPIVLMALMEQSAMQQDSALPLDLHLLEQARKGKKKLLGIETVAEQINALQSLSYREQAAMVSLEMSKQQDVAAATDAMMEYYISGKLDSLLALNNRNPMPEKLAKALLDNRNDIMAERIAAMIKKQSVFAAVGALHLPGDNGVIALLRKKGFAVEVVK